MALKLGTAKIDITPKHPLPLAGFAHRHGVYEQVMDPIYVRVFYFEQTDKQNETEAIILVTADIIWWDDERVQMLQSKLLQMFGIKKESVVLHATHNHSGPQTSEKFRSLGKIDHQYIEDLE